MKRLYHLIIITGLLLMGSVVNVHAQRKAHNTSSGRAAYGKTAPSKLKAHKKRNQKAKNKARKATRRKKLRDEKVPYRGMPI